VFALAEVMSRTEASRLVTAAAARAASGGAGFADALTAEPRIAELLPPARIAELLDPAGYLGASQVWIDRALAAHRDTPTDPAGSEDKDRSP
jgi:3-carboxy-cis,cis-muconate cycloisomerase